MDKIKMETQMFGCIPPTAAYFLITTNGITYIGNNLTTTIDDGIPMLNFVCDEKMMTFVAAQIKNTEFVSGHTGCT